MGTDLNLFQQANSVEIFIPAIPYQGLNNELSRRKMLNGKKYPMRNKIESKDFNSNRNEVGSRWTTSEVEIFSLNVCKFNYPMGSLFF